MDKIEFYKNRSLDERFSASAGFIRQNGKVLYKMILIVAVPFALVMGYFGQGYVSSVMNFRSLANPYELGYSMGSYFLLYLLFMLVLQGTTAAVMNKYQEGLLSKETKLKELGSKIFSNMWKIFLVIFLLVLIIMGISVLFGLFFGFLTVLSRGLAIIATIIFILAFVALFPPMSLTIFPILFQGASVGTSVKKGFTLGCRNWGSTFVTILIVGIVTAVATYTFTLPNTIWGLFHPAEFAEFGSGILSYSLITLSSFAPAFVTPISFIFLAFQYFSILEKSEGISLQSKIEEFDNL